MYICLFFLSLWNYVAGLRNNDSFRMQDILLQQQLLFPTNSNFSLLVFSHTSHFFTHEGF